MDVPESPSIAIFVHAGDTEPTVFRTAMSKQEEGQLFAWIKEHPDLEELVERAQWLAENPIETGSLDTTFDATQEVHNERSE